MTKYLEISFASIIFNYFYIEFKDFFIYRFRINKIRTLYVTGGKVCSKYQILRVFKKEASKQV